MSDVFAVDLSLDLSPAVPSAVLDDLRRHLGMEDDNDSVVDDTYDEVRLLTGRGRAARIGGVLVGELVQSADRWSLTAHQEVHAEFLADLDSLAGRLAAHAKTEGVIGQMRFYEDDVPDMLINRSGTLVKLALRPAGSADS